jgi:hypothetical protein
MQLKTRDYKKEISVKASQQNVANVAVDGEEKSRKMCLFSVRAQHSHLYISTPFST